MGELTWSIHVLQRTVKERLKQPKQTTSDSISAEADTKMLKRRKFKTTHIIGSTVQRSGDEMDCNPTEYSGDRVLEDIHSRIPEFKESDLQ